MENAVRRRAVAQAEATQQLSTARAFSAAITQAKAGVARTTANAQQAARTLAAEHTQAESARKVCAVSIPVCRPVWICRGLSLHLVGARPSCRGPNMPLHGAVHLGTEAVHVSPV